MATDTTFISILLDPKQAIESFGKMMDSFSKQVASGDIGKKLSDSLTRSAFRLSELAENVAPFSDAARDTLVGATMAAVDFNSAISNAARSLDLSASETKNFSDQVLQLAPTLGILPEKFAEVAGEAGKLGVAKNEVAEFGATLGRLATISDTPIEQFTKLAGAIKNQFNLSVKEFESFGASVNALDDIIGGTTPNILNFTSRIGSISKSIGFTAGETAAFGAVFEKLGFSADVSGTAFNNLVNQLFTIQSASGPAKEAFESLGFSADDFGRKMASDPKQALFDFLDTLNAIPDSSDRASKIVQILGKEGLGAITAIAGQTDTLRQAFDQANQSGFNANKMMTEFGAKMNDPKVQMEVIKSQLSVLAIQLGHVLVPILGQVIEILGPLLTKFGDFLGQNPEWAKFFAIALGGVAILAPLISGLAGLASAAAFLAPMFIGISGAIAGFIAAIATVPVAIAAVSAVLIALVFNLGGARDKAGMILGQMIENFKISMGFIGDAIANLSIWQILNTYIWQPVVSFFAQLRDMVFAAGRGFITGFTDGFKAAAPTAVADVNHFLSQIRNLLPFSPAKMGPLSDLDKSGSSFFSTFASGLDINQLQSQLTSQLGQLSMTPQTPQLATVGATTASSGSMAPITYNQNIEISSSVNARDIITALKSAQREFLTFLNESNSVQNRRQF